MPGRLLLATESYSPNLDGGALFQHRLAHAMADREWDVTVWAPSTRGESTVERDGPVTVIRAVSRVLRSNPRYRVSRPSGLRPRRVFDVAAPDIVHVHNPAWIGWAALAVAARRSVPVVATNHLLPVNVLANSRRVPGGEALVWRYLRLFHNLADVVVSPSQTGARLLAAAGVRRRIEVISNGVSVRLFTPDPKPSRVDGLNLVYVGRVDPEKQVDCLVRGVAAARRRVRVRLEIVGPCNDPYRLNGLISDLGAANYIRLCGVVSEEDKRAVLRRANAFCTASTAELECIAILEAMASGLPIIAPAAGALPELVRPGTTGLLFRPGSVSGLAKAITEAAELPLSGMGEAARTLVCHERDEEATYAAYETVFEELRGGPACG